MIKECEKLVEQANMEIHAVKWMFYNSDLFDESNINDD